MAGEAQEFKGIRAGSIFGLFERNLQWERARGVDYLALAGGVRLAYDLILPTKNHVPATERLPVLFKYTPYLRTFTVFESVRRKHPSRNCSTWVGKPGLGCACGTGCPAGTGDGSAHADPLARTPVEARIRRDCGRAAWHQRIVWQIRPEFLRAAAKEADQVHWIAAQPWSNGKVGMYEETRGKAKSNSRPRAPGTAI